MVTDIGDYKKCVTSRFEHAGNATETKFNHTDAKISNIESNSAITENKFVAAGRRLDAMDMALTRMVESVRALQNAFTIQGTAPPQTFNMSTPVSRLSILSLQPRLRDSTCLQAAANQNRRPLVEDVHLGRTRRTFHRQLSPE